MRLLAILCLLFVLPRICAQNLEQIVEDYIRKNDVITVFENDTSYYKTGKPYLKKYARGGKSLTVPKGAIPIPMSTGNYDTTGKFYTSDALDNVKLTLYIVQSVDEKEIVNAVNGGEINKGCRTRVDILVDYKSYQKATIYCYFLNGVVFGAPFQMTKDCDTNIYNYEKNNFVTNKYIPALLIFEENKGSQKRKKLIEKMKIDNFLNCNIEKYKDIYKELGNYCIIYYRLTENEENK